MNFGLPIAKFLARYSASRRKFIRGNILFYFMLVFGIFLSNAVGNTACF